jgi:UDP-glucose 6-dehydrogenase
MRWVNEKWLFLSWKNTQVKKLAPIEVCVNPEFLTEIHRSWVDNESYARDFFNKEHVVIGEFDKRSGDVVKALHKPLTKDWEIER